MSEIDVYFAVGKGKLIRRWQEKGTCMEKWSTNRKPNEVL